MNTSSLSEENTTASGESSHYLNDSEFWRQNKVISDDYMPYINIFFEGSMFLVLSLLGIGTNGLNITVLAKLATKDNTIVALMALVVSDLMGSLTLLLTPICFFVDRIYPKVPVAMRYLNVAVLSFAWEYFNMVSTFIIAFLTLGRCLGIILPLKVKNAMTKKRTLIIIVAIFAINLPLYASVMATVEFAEVHVPDFNVTKMLAYHSELTAQIFEVLNVYAFVVPVLSQATVSIGTVVLLVHGSKTSEKVRVGMTQENNTSDEIDETETSTSKDRNKIRVVTAIAIAFLICNTPMTAMVLFMNITGAANEVDVYPNLTIVLYHLARSFLTINSIAKVFIFYTLSSKFRSVLQGMFKKSA